MSANSSADPLPSTAASSNKSKKKTKKKKGSAANSTKDEVIDGEVDNGNQGAKENGGLLTGDERGPKSAVSPLSNDTSHVDEESMGKTPQLEKENGITSESEIALAQAPANTDDTDTESRLEAMVKERDLLRAEVRELRESLESIQGKHKMEINEAQEKHQGEVDELQEQLEESQASKEHAETQHRNLLGKINTIKSQLGERLKQDAEDLAQARSDIESLEERNHIIQQERDSIEETLAQTRKEIERYGEEVANLRSRASLSQQNWIKERDGLVQREAYAKDEFENAKQAMQDWEVLAMEERSLRESLGERVSELEDQLSSMQDLLNKTTNERDTQSQTVDGLQRAIKDIQDARKKELRELVENSQKQLDEAQKQLQEAENTCAKAKAELDITKNELYRAAPFEKEVKEKSLQLGKLRHEAVILNSHLTKALRMLKKGKPEDNVDRQIVTNHFLQFLALDRSDPKKFQILQLIAALLGWTDEQREQAGLSRPGASNSTLRVPISPFRRTPSTPSLNTEAAFMSESGNSKESLAELWSQFLEHEAANGSQSSPQEGAANPSPLDSISRSGSNVELNTS